MKPATKANGTLLAYYIGYEPGQSMTNSTEHVHASDLDHSIVGME